MKTLGIETSCDETAIAIYDSEKGIVGESIYSQMKMHAEYGGVVPELASRDHCSKIVNVLKNALGNHSLDRYRSNCIYLWSRSFRSTSNW